MFKLNVYDKVIDGGTEGIISNMTIPNMAVLQGAMSTFERTESWPVSIDLKVHPP